MKESTKQYWIQTAKLTGIMFLIVFVVLLSTIANAVAEQTLYVMQLLGITIAAGFAVVLYEGYGFWRGVGGYIIANFIAKIFVLSSLMAFATASGSLG